MRVARLARWRSETLVEKEKAKLCVARESKERAERSSNLLGCSSCQFSVIEQQQLRKEKLAFRKRDQNFYSKSLILAQNERWRRG